MYWDTGWHWGVLEALVCIEDGGRHCFAVGGTGDTGDGSVRHWEHWFVLGSNGDTGGSEGHWEHWFVLGTLGGTG